MGEDGCGLDGLGLVRCSDEKGSSSATLFFFFSTRGGCISV
jgi:hypothetical protein